MRRLSNTTWCPVQNRRPFLSISVIVRWQKFLPFTSSSSILEKNMTNFMKLSWISIKLGRLAKVFGASQVTYGAQKRLRRKDKTAATSRRESNFCHTFNDMLWAYVGAISGLQKYPRSFTADYWKLLECLVFWYTVQQCKDQIEGWEPIWLQFFRKIVQQFEGQSIN